jgi:hypothetical protein
MIAPNGNPGCPVHTSSTSFFHVFFFTSQLLASPLQRAEFSS